MFNLAPFPHASQLNINCTNAKRSAHTSHIFASSSLRTSKSLIACQPKATYKYLLSHACHMFRPSPPPTISGQQVLLVTPALLPGHIVTSSPYKRPYLPQQPLQISSVSVLPFKQHGQYKRRHKFNRSSVQHATKMSVTAHCPHGIVSVGGCSRRR